MLSMGNKMSRCFALFRLLMSGFPLKFSSFNAPRPHSPNEPPAASASAVNRFLDKLRHAEHTRTSVSVRKGRLWSLRPHLHSLELLQRRKWTQVHPCQVFPREIQRQHLARRPAVGLFHDFEPPKPFGFHL